MSDVRTKIALPLLESQKEVEDLFTWLYDGLLEFSLKPDLKPGAIINAGTSIARIAERYELSGALKSGAAEKIKQVAGDLNEIRLLCGYIETGATPGDVRYARDLEQQIINRSQQAVLGAEALGLSTVSAYKYRTNLDASLSQAAKRGETIRQGRLLPAPSYAEPRA